MGSEEEEEERDMSSSEEDEDDDAFDEDMEALKRACMITGTNPDDLNNSSATPTAGESISKVEDEEDEDDDDEDDLELVRNIKNRFSTFEPLSLKPLCVLPPAIMSDDDEGDDFETLRAIQKRFAAYDCDAFKSSRETSFETQEQVHDPRVSLEKSSSTDLIVHGNAACSISDSEYTGGTASQSGGHLEMQPSADITWHHRNNSNTSTSQSNYSSFPKSARVFMDAIKKNRSFQKILRSKLIQIEKKIEENKKLKERFKILRDFQVNCKRRTGRALSQLKDSRVQLISRKKPWPCKDSKVHDKRIPAMYYGPEENSHVSNYKMALTKFPLSLERKKWSENETQNLEKGIQQQFQEKMVQVMVDRFSGGNGEYHDVSNDLDNILASIKNLDITSENIRAFLPKVNWEYLASMHLVGRSGAECEARWLNFEDPLINRNPWTAEEDKYLLLFVQEKGISNWIDIAASLRTNRTPFQCLARYQRSLNVSILKRDWTKDDDAKLRSAVEIFGESDWQSVASVLEGWTGTQCSNRWKKSLHPTREKVGRWTADEDKRLVVAQLLFGPRNWKKTALFVPGRTEVQCRERFVNSLDPSLNWDKWTAEEDAKLRAAIAEYGYCWAKVAAAVPRRTDNMCRRRWKKLLPDEVPLLQAARRIQKAAFIGNFVDRESERPALCPGDFGPLRLMANSENTNQTNKQAGKLREVKKRNVKKSIENSQTDQKEVLGISNVSNHGEAETQGTQKSKPEAKKRKRCVKQQSKATDLAEPNEERELQPEKLNPTNDGDWNEPLGQADRLDPNEAITRQGSRKSNPETKKRRRSYKQHSKMTDLTEPNEELLQPEKLNPTSEGDWTEPFDATEAITRRNSQKSKPETKERKQTRKRHSKSKDLPKPNEEGVCPLLQPEKSNLRNDGDRTEFVGQGDTVDVHEAITRQGSGKKSKSVAKKRKQSSETSPKMTELAEPNEERECIPLQTEKLNSSSDGITPQSTESSLKQKSGKSTLDSCKHQHSDLSSDKSSPAGIATDVSVQNGGSSCLDSTNIMAVDTVGGNDKIASEKNKGTKQYKRRAKKAVSVPSQQNGMKELTETTVCSDQNDVTADFDLPLISFLKNKPKKRKLEANGCDSNHSHPPLITQKEADTSNAGSLMPITNDDSTFNKFGSCNLTSDFAMDNSAAFGSEIEAGTPYLDLEMESINVESSDDANNTYVITEQQTRESESKIRATVTSSERKPSKQDLGTGHEVAPEEPKKEKGENGTILAYVRRNRLKIKI
ncbi:hypothetical protein CsatB_016145 [Cannabis sativa]